MKVFLVHRERDLDLQEESPTNREALAQDLELETLIGAMSGGDKFVGDVARGVVLRGLTDPDAIAYRQGALADCLRRPDVVGQMYEIVLEALRSERKVYVGLLRDSPDRILHRSLQTLDLLLEGLRQLRRLAGEHAHEFRSEAFARFFAMLAEELDDAYLATVERHLDELRFPGGVLMSAGLGKGNKGARYVLHRPPERGWLGRIADTIADGGRQNHSFRIADRDESGHKALRRLQGRGINPVANAIARSADHVLGFFAALRAELAFYVGCLNLHERPAAKGEPTCFPDPTPAGRPVLSASGLYDACLALKLEGERVVGNDLAADGKSLVMITGTNRGGKSTFLRAVGLAQLMMQCGMFVPAESFRADVRHGLFTHHKREEDATMKSGKLDEELARMSAIADEITPNGILLCNESFAATNEREGSEIARQVLRALTEAGVKVLFVTHLFNLAHGFYREGSDAHLFLRAERKPDGGRTFRLAPGEPLPTSHGEDSYRRVFGSALGSAPEDTGAASVEPDRSRA